VCIDDYHLKLVGGTDKVVDSADFKLLKTFVAYIVVLLQVKYLKSYWLVLGCKYRGCYEEFDFINAKTCLFKKSV